MCKILYVITQGEWGGAQRYVFDLATNLKDDFEITVAVGEPAGRIDLQNKLNLWNMEHGTCNIKIVLLRHMVRSISPIHDILAIFELAKLYRTLKPNIIHLNSSKAGIIGSFARLLELDSRLRGNDKMKIIYTVHGWVFNEPNRKIGRWLYRFLEKSTARWKDKIIVLSSQDLLTGKQLGIPEKKLIEIPLGIETPKFLSKEDAHNSLSQITNYKLQITNFVVGTIANLYKTKGVDMLVDAVNNVVNVKNVESVKFVVIGEGLERKRLENLIKKYKLENIIFLIGALDDAARYLPAFDIFVLPSRKEGLPYTLLEAMAQGTPIIATDTGGVSSLIKNKENGLLIEPESPRQLSDTLLEAINNYSEMKKRARRAFEDIKQFTLKKMIDDTKTTYFSDPPE